MTKIEITLPADVIESWEDAEKAGDAEIAELTAIANTVERKLPLQYANFLKVHGFVEFGNDDDDTSMFSYRLGGPENPQLKYGNIAFLAMPDRVCNALHIMTAENPDERTPLIPQGYLPVGNDACQGLVLISFADESVWYWPEKADIWGTGDNTEIGYVAQDFEHFINGLQPYDQ